MNELLLPKRINFTNRIYIYISVWFYKYKTQSLAKLIYGIKNQVYTLGRGRNY